MPDGDERKTDWIDAAVALGGALGFNRVKLRWKLMAWRDSWKGTGRQTQAQLKIATYRHKICPHCGTVQDRANKKCLQCGQSLGPQFFQILRRVGLVAFHFESVSSILTGAILIAYVRTALAQGSLQFIEIPAQTLVAFGANWAPLVLEGQWWRLATYIFLHGGIIHILFNLFALQQIGPQIEEVFGRGRMLLYFMVTGIAAGIGSGLMHPGAFSIGTSGSLMGFCGLLAGWGQKDGTPTGKALRDMGLTWCLYTMVFGFLAHADNAAHGAGFLCGAALGLVTKPRWERRGGTLDGTLTLLGIVLAGGAFFLVLFPPA